MDTVSILFTRRHHPGSVAVRVGTWSAWSHVDLVDGEGPAATVIGALAFSGVAEEPLAYRLAHASRAALVQIPSADPQAVLAAARSQLGKPYDWAGIAGLITRNRNWQEEDCWFCSELIAWAFAQAGQPLFRAELVNRVNPQHLWMLAHPAQRPEHPMDLLIHA